MINNLVCVNNNNNSIMIIIGFGEAVLYDVLRSCLTEEELTNIF